MNLTAEGKIMYEVMTAIYESGIPMNFKGSMVLKACLAEAGYLEDIRHTVDIDGNWYSDVAPTGEQMVESIHNAGRTLDNFEAFLNKQEELSHSYEKFRFAGNVNKPAFDDVYNTVKEYINAALCLAIVLSLTACGSKTIGTIKGAEYEKIAIWQIGISALKLIRNMVWVPLN